VRRVQHRSDLTPSLFDEPVEQAPAIEQEDELDDWDEVPQARFLSWSEAMQLHYCYRRDLDAALRAECSPNASFYLERAQRYKEALERLSCSSRQE
jgi:hypothetical protein